MILCKNCKSRKVANQWKCVCGHLWANCAIHRNMGMKCCNLSKAKAAANKMITQKQATGDSVLSEQAKKRRITAEKTVDQEARDTKVYRKRKAEAELERKTRKSDKQEAREMLTATFKDTCFLLVNRGGKAQGAQEAINSRLLQMGRKDEVEISTLPTTLESMEWKNEVQEKIAACQIRLHIIPVDFKEPMQGLRHQEAYSLGNQKDACVTLVEWRCGNRVLFHDSLCIQRKRMEAHPIDERAGARKQPKKETHLQQYERKRRISQMQSIAKRRKLFTLINGKIVKIDTKDVVEGVTTNQGAKCEHSSSECSHTATDSHRPSGNMCQSSSRDNVAHHERKEQKQSASRDNVGHHERNEQTQRHDERLQQQVSQEDDMDPLGLGFELE